MPVHTVETILISVISMLADPNDESPANVDAAVSIIDDVPMIIIITTMSRFILYFYNVTFYLFNAERMARELYRIQTKGGKVRQKKPRGVFVGDE